MCSVVNATNHLPLAKPLTATAAKAVSCPCLGVPPKELLHGPGKAAQVETQRSTHRHRRNDDTIHNVKSDDTGVPRARRQPMASPIQKMTCTKAPIHTNGVNIKSMKLPITVYAVKHTTDSFVMVSPKSLFLRQPPLFLYSIACWHATLTEAIRHLSSWRCSGTGTNFLPSSG